MASYKYIRHTAAEIDEAIEQEREHCANEASHTCQEEKDRWNGAAELAETNTSDILSAKNGIAVNRATLGTQCKNRLEITATSKTAEETNGLTITVNDDKSITINGTAPSSGYRFTVGIFAPEELRQYILSGCPSGGGSTTYQIYSEDGTDYSIYNGYTASVKFTPKLKKKRYFNIIVYGNVVCNNLTFYPMIRPADITDNAYEPYKPSLQEQINALIAEIAELKANQTTE